MSEENRCERGHDCEVCDEYIARLRAELESANKRIAELSSRLESKHNCLDICIQATKSLKVAEAELSKMREESVPWEKVQHLMAMLLRLGLVTDEVWFETWHTELHAAWTKRKP